MTKLTRMINILDTYANAATIAIIYGTEGTKMYQGSAMNIPYHFIRCYTKNHFYQAAKQIIEIWL